MPNCKNYTGYKYLIKGESCDNFNFNIDLVGNGSLGGSGSYEAILTFTQRLNLIRRRNQEQDTNTSGSDDLAVNVKTATSDQSSHTAF